MNFEGIEGIEGIECIDELDLCNFSQLEFQQTESLIERNHIYCNIIGIIIIVIFIGFLCYKGFQKKLK